MNVCGLDVHKSRCWVHIQDENGVLHKSSILRTPEGLEKLQQILHEHQTSKVIMESTNTYWIPIYRLINPNIECCVINAFQRKVLGKHKTDERDAEDLAR